MSIFGNVFTKKNKKDNDNCCDLHTIEETACTCRDTHWPTSHADNSSIAIKIMGTGCKKCHQLHENAHEAAKHSDKTVKIEYITDIAEIAAAGVISTPALLIDDKVASTGKVLSPNEIEKMLG